MRRLRHHRVVCWNYDDLPWIAPLLEVVRQIRGRAKRVGICFGHQAMAKAFGGEVAKPPKGWGLGIHRYDIVGPPPGMVEPLTIAIPVFHQDQAVTLPPDVRVLAADGFTPYATLGYDDDMFSIQGHPELTPEFSTALIEAQRDRYGPLADAALLSLWRPNDGGRAAAWLNRFVNSGGLDTPS